jgi:hypothetical protein
MISSTSCGGVKELIRVRKGIDDRDAAIAYAKECLAAFENGGSLGAENGESPKAAAAGPSSRSNGANGANGRGNAGAGAHQPHRRKLEKIFPYRVPAGRVAFEVLRYAALNADGGYATDARGKRLKYINQRRPSGDPDGCYIWGLGAGAFMRPAPGRDWIEFDGARFEQYPATTRESHEFKVAAPVIPYRLPELIKAVAAGQTICIAEGELKCDVIACFGFVATCCAGGAGKWLLEHSAYLTDADVVLLPDNDEAGRDHMTAVAESLLRKARRIRVLTPARKGRRR